MSGPIVLVLVCLAILQVAESARFTFPSGTTVVDGNQTETVEMTWRYSLAGGETISKINCGFNQNNVFQLMVFKQGSSSASVYGGASFPSDFSGRVDALEKTNEIGILIRSLRKTDNKEFFCDLDIGQPANIRSSTIRLRILDPPKFESCLDRRASNYTGIENRPFTTNCSATGIPAPTISCHLLDTSNRQVQKATGASGLALHYIASSLSRFYTKIVCIADGKEAGIAKRESYLNVRFPPSEPTNFRVTQANNRSITVSWEPPVVTGGLNIIGYGVEYQRGGIVTPLNATSVVARTLTIEPLQANAVYIVRGFAYNNAGRGNLTRDISQSTINAPNPGESSDDDSTTIIIAVVVPVVVIIIVVAIVLYFVCCRKKSAGKQKYPTSYVEDATDYPAQINMQPEASPLYSKVKKEPAKDHNMSTSGYPDIVNQANGKQKRDDDNNTMRETQYNNKGNNYEQDFSPSYEHSTKEYV